MNYQDFEIQLAPFQALEDALCFLTNYDRELGLEEEWATLMTTANNPRANLGQALAQVRMSLQNFRTHCEIVKKRIINFQKVLALDSYSNGADRFDDEMGRKTDFSKKRKNTEDPDAPAKKMKF